MDNKLILQLIERAKIARQNAYSPYSSFSVGAAILSDNGKIYSGCNVECAAFGAGTCAERAALSNAVSDGEKSFEAIAIIAKNDEYCMPCGICRQALYEFSPDLTVICCKEDGEYKIFILNELLPFAFNNDALI